MVQSELVKVHTCHVTSVLNGIKQSSNRHCFNLHEDRRCGLSVTTPAAIRDTFMKMCETPVRGKESPHCSSIHILIRNLECQCAHGLQDSNRIRHIEAVRAAMVHDAYSLLNQASAALQVTMPWTLLAFPWRDVLPMTERLESAGPICLSSSSPTFLHDLPLLLR